MGNDCGNDCDRQCDSHGTTALLISQHELRIGDQENTLQDVSADVSKIEGRINVFTWVVGMFMGILCTIAFYGLIQLTGFKDMHMETTIQIHKSLSDIESDVTLLKKQRDPK